MMIPLTNVIQIKSYGKLVAIAALKSWGGGEALKKFKNAYQQQGNSFIRDGVGIHSRRTKTFELQQQYLLLLLVSISYDSLNQQQLSPYRSPTSPRKGDAVFTVT
jgi:hypothetical protein